MTSLLGLNKRQKEGADKVKLIARAIMYTLEINGESFDIAFLGEYAEDFIDKHLNHAPSKRALPLIIKSIIESDSEKLHKEVNGTRITVSYMDDWKKPTSKFYH